MRLHSILAIAGAATSVKAVDLDVLRIKASARYTKSADVNGNPSIKLLKRGDFVETATDLVKSIAPDATFRVKDDSYVGTNGFSHVFLQQTAHDLDIDNAIFNVNIDKEGNVFSYGNSFFAGELPAESPRNRRQSLPDPVEALETVHKALELPIQIPNNAVTELASDQQEGYFIKNIAGVETDPKVTQVYLVKSDGQLALVWKVHTIVKDTSFSSYVEGDSGASEVIAVLDHVDYWSYEVYPFGLNDPREGERTVIDNPLDSKASPLGWHDPKNTVSGMYDTEGNNIMAGAVPVIPGTFNEAKSPNESFAFPYVPDGGTPNDFYQAGVTQAFYTANMLHDLYYLLGFTPAAGNYQKDNNGEGGKGNDPVQINLQTSGGKNNGNFQQSADGGRGILSLYLFNHTDPERDSAFDNGFLIHEYTHGLSDRLTGGASTTGCLNAWEADGMAEGWSDLFAAALTIKPSENRDTASYGFAAWSLNQTNPPTARLRMYSTNMDVNEFTYSSANGLTNVHEVGTVWATMLYEVLWNLVDKYGKNDNPRPEIVNGVPTDGKFLTLKILIDAFAIQPCNPSIVQARDAIIDADVALSGGENACEIWKGFAKRGLGAGAVTADPRVDNFDLPDGVC